MTVLEVIFSEDTLSEKQQDDISWALGQVSNWQIRVDQVSVTREFRGGRSEAIVLDAVLRGAGQSRACVIKIDSVAELAREWTAYNEVVLPDPSTLLVPIMAASKEVVEGVDAWDTPGVLVYNHAVRFAAAHPDLPVTMLEDLVASAFQEPDQVPVAVRAIETLLVKATHVLYAHGKVTQDPTSLRQLNSTLGPNVTVRVDRIDDHGRLAYGELDLATMKDVLRPPTTVLRDSTRCQPADLAAGGLLCMRDLTVTKTDPLIAESDAVVVRIEGLGGHVRSVGDSIDVCGSVVDVRGPVRAVRIKQALGAADVGPVADPMGALHPALTESAPGRAVSLIHGDLNARNVLLVDDQPFLIDYPRTGADCPQQTDFGWLEIALLRDVFATLGHAELVRLQRVLALGSRLLGLVDSERICLDLLGDVPNGMLAAFRMLFAIRRGAHASYPADAGPPWWRDYFQHLLLSAHRTLKWTAPVQTDATVVAAAAAASVATEWLTDGNPFANWPTGDITAALTALAPLLPMDSDAAVHLIGHLVAIAPNAENLIDKIRERLVRARCAEPARWLMVKMADRHGEYLELPATWMSEPDVATLPRVDDEYSAAEPAEPVEAITAVGNAIDATITGDPGSGKTSVLRELSYRLAANVIAADQGLPKRMPVGLRGSTLARDRPDPVKLVGDLFGPVGAEALTFGAVHLMIAGLDDVDLGVVSAWIQSVRLRFPRTAIAVDCRLAGNHARELGFPVLRLGDLQIDTIRTYLYRTLVPGRLRADEAEQLIRTMFEDPAWARLNPNSPLLVRRLVEHVRDIGVPANPATLYGAMFRRRRLGEAEVRFATTLAERLVEAGTAELEVTADDTDQGLETLVRSGILRRDGSWVGFAERTDRDFLAAGALLKQIQDSGSIPVDKVLSPRWRDPWRALVTLPEVGHAIMTDLMRVAATADPAWAGDLLGSAADRQPDLEAELAAAQLETLRRADAGVAAWSAAAGALFEIGAVAELWAVGSNAGSPPKARCAALESLVALHQWGRNRTLARMLRRVLLEASDLELRECAVRAVAQTRSRGLELHVGELVDPAQPWPVVREAVTALRALGVSLTSPIIKAYRGACANRLVELEQLLRAESATRVIRELQAERAELTEVLSGEERQTWLLRLRFAFELADEIGERLELPGDGDVDHWLAMIDRGSPEDAAGAAHLLLREAPDRAGMVLERIDADSADDRLRIAAAAVRHAGFASLHIAENLFRSLIPVVDEDRAEGFSALLCEIFALDRARGVWLAWTAARALISRDVPWRHTWPWRSALARTRGTAKDHEWLLHTDVELGIEALSSGAFPVSADPPLRHGFSADTRELVVRSRPEPGSPVGEIVRWVVAAAAVSAIDALPTIRKLVVDPSLAASVYPRGSGKVREQAALGEVLAASGYLGRQSGDGEVLAFLRDLDTTALHPSVEFGRLVGLAYLGEVIPLLEALPGDARTVRAARNALEYWTIDRGPVDRWIDERLGDTSLTIALRRQLEELSLTVRSG